MIWRWALLVWLALAGLAQAQDLRALVRVVPEQTELRDARFAGTTRITLALSQGTPFRVYTLGAPNRLIVELRGVDPEGVDLAALNRSRRITDLRLGRISADWTRLVMVLAEPLEVSEAGMRIDSVSQEARLAILLRRQDQAAFDALAGAPEGASTILLNTPPPDTDADDPRRPLRIVLDPGHGGIDPGAQRDGVDESALMLAMARDLQEVLRRAGGFEVFLTRDSDVFVSLDERVSIAQRVDADLFVSLHADALAEGRAEGATVYTLSDTASDAASEALAARHDRSEILSGVDLMDAGSDVASALLDLARQDTAPRSDRLAQEVVKGIQAAVGRVNTRPLRQAGFSVLKSADVPSILIEVGFLSTQADLRDLQDPLWRQRLAAGIRDGLQAWALEDAATRALRRQ